MQSPQDQQLVSIEQLQEVGQQIVDNLVHQIKTLSHEQNNPSTQTYQDDLQRDSNIVHRMQQMQQQNLKQVVTSGRGAFDSHSGQTQQEIQEVNGQTNQRERERENQGQDQQVRSEYVHKLNKQTKSAQQGINWYTVAGVAVTAVTILAAILVKTGRTF